MELARTLRITNSRGLHARPCHALASTALQFASEVRLSCEGREADGKSILELMTLEAGCGQELEVRARGTDARELLDALERVVAAGFGESS